MFPAAVSDSSQIIVCGEYADSIMETDGEGKELATLLYDGEEFEVPVELLQDKTLFKKVLSLETWSNVLTSDDRNFLQGLLPAGASPVFKDEVIGLLFSGQQFKFGNPVEQVWDKLNEGSYSPETFESKEQLKDLKYQQYQLDQKRYHLRVLQELLLSRQEMLQAALATGSLDNLPKRTKLVGKKRNTLHKRAKVKFRRIVAQCRKECGCEGAESSDDEVQSSSDGGGDTGEDTPTVTEGDYRRMLKAHYRLKLWKKNSGEAVSVVAVNQVKLKLPPVPDEESTPVPSCQNSPALDASPRSREPEMASLDDDPPPPCMPRSKVSPNLELQQVYKVYSQVDSEMKKDVPVTPITLVGPLPSDKHLSFFGVIKSAFEAQQDKKGELSKISKSVGAILKEYSSFTWLKAKKDWVELTHSALLYLSAEVGAVCTFDSLPHFIPLIEFRDRIDHWKWIGQDRDSEVELLVLCNHWLETLDRALPIIDYSDYDPPTPRVWTHAVFKQTTPSEVQRFREQEVERYNQPHKAYTFNIHGYEASVGPVKGARAPSSKKEGGGSRARGHALLVAERPNCVTILSLVRDATSRLPNGEGTRIDLCILVRDSHYLQETVSDTQLNNAVSGALDRLHYEKDPCVRYDNARKLWIYLHRGRSEEEFELIHWASEVAAKQRKYFIMSRPKIKPKIIIKTPDGQTTEVSPGSGSVTTPKTPLTPLSIPPTLTPTLPPILTPSAIGSSSRMGPGTTPVSAKPSPKTQPRRQVTHPQATPTTQTGSKTTPVAVVSSGGKQVVVASIMPGKMAGSQQQSLNTLALVQQALAKQQSQLSLQLGGGAHEGKGTAQLSLDAAQLLTQLMAARGGVTAGLSSLSSFAASIGGGGGSAGVNVGGVSSGAVGVTGKGGVSVVPPQQEWLTESEEEGLPVGDDWEGSESD